MGHALSALSHHQVVDYAHAQNMDLEFSLQDSPNFLYHLYSSMLNYQGCGKFLFLIQIISGLINAFAQKPV